MRPDLLSWLQANLNLDMYTDPWFQVLFMVSVENKSVKAVCQFYTANVTQDP